MIMNFGILGSGGVGQTLAAKLVSLGHGVMVGTRDPQKLAEWASGDGAGAQVGSFAEAAAFGDVLMLATRWEQGATENALRLAGSHHFVGKVVIDITNPLDFSTGAPRLANTGGQAAAEHIQAWLPGARVVKALNIVTAAVMVNPSLTGDTPDMLIAGDDADAKHVVTDLLHEFGWRSVIDFGGLESARYIEPLVMLWVIYWQKTGKGMHAFKLVGKPV
jgi:predicted dinucleotide-binding enzyme